MIALVEMFEPLNLGDWILRLVILYAVSYFAIWLLAVILCRLLPIVKGGVILRVYFGWLIPLTIHSIFSTVFLLASAAYYKEMGVDLWFCTVYLIPVFLSGALGINLSIKIKERVTK